MSNDLSSADLSIIEQMQRDNENAQRDMEEWKQLYFSGFQAWSIVETSLSGIFAWAITGKQISDDTVPACYAFRAARNLGAKLHMTSAALSSLTLSDETRRKWKNIENRLNKYKQIRNSLVHDVLNSPMNSGAAVLGPPAHEIIGGGDFKTSTAGEVGAWITSVKQLGVVMNEFQARLGAIAYKPKPRQIQNSNHKTIQQSTSARRLLTPQSHS